MSNRTSTHRRWRWRAISVIVVGIAVVMTLATPALGHPVFSNDSPGFPNPQGSTTDPYPAGSRATLNMFLPFEQEGVIFNGAENTTVDVKVTIPAGWTSPACGPVRTASAAGYRQVGTGAQNWTCAMETVDAHQVLHWTGPQVSPSQTFADSAQFFTFEVTVPSPATQTSYGASASTAEGFYVEQRYADGFTSLWRTPNSTRPGEIANGIIRTVAGTAPPDPNQPTVSPPPDETHAGPPSKPNPPGGNPAGPSPPPRTQGGNAATPAPVTKPPPSGPATATTTPSPLAQDSPAPTTTLAEPLPGSDPQPSSAVDQRAQQREDSTGQGFRWQVVAAIVLALVIVAGAVIALVRRRRLLP